MTPETKMKSSISEADTSIYDEVVAIAYDYLGPAAGRFMTRQIETHLKKKPEQLTRADIPTLLDWCKLSIALLTEDKRIVTDFARRLTVVANRHDE